MGLGKSQCCILFGCTLVLVLQFYTIITVFTHKYRKTYDSCITVMRCSSNDGVVSGTGSVVMSRRHALFTSINKNDYSTVHYGFY